MAELFLQFISTFYVYIKELWFTLALGFLLSGVIHLYIPEKIVDKYLGQRGLKPIFLSSIIGTILPVCCIGSLPIAVTLKRKGARMGAILAFLITTPATSISALIVCWKLMGAMFTLIIFISVIIMGLLVGLIANQFSWNIAEEGNNEQSLKKEDCCHKDKPKTEFKQGFLEKLKEILIYAYIDLPKNMGLEILIGIALASFIDIYEPLQNFIQHYLVGIVGYVFILFFGLFTYVCSTASVPMAHALLNSGMSVGQAVCYLLVGPITSYGTILVIRKDFGNRALLLYLSVISICAVLTGILVDIFNVI